MASAKPASTAKRLHAAAAEATAGVHSWQMVPPMPGKRMGMPMRTSTTTNATTRAFFQFTAPSP